MDVSDIFYFFFFARGGGRESTRRQEGGGSIFKLKIPGGGGGGFQEGPRGWEVVCGELGNLGGGGLNIFFRGRNVHQDF